MEIQLANNKGVVIVDDEDHEKIKGYSWHIHKAGTKDYARAWIHGRREYMHRVIMSGDLIDHINGNGLDNRKSNLRLADKSLNAINSKVRSDNSTGYKGVTFNKKASKYMAEISRNGKKKYLGLFNTAKEAHEAYLTASKENDTII